MGVKVAVPARVEWFDTKIDVKASRVLNLTASGVWVDFYIPCGADGYPAPLFYGIGKGPRVQDSGRYFRLLGRIGDPAGPPSADTPLNIHDPNGTFIIGRSATYTPLRDGRLYVFANDSPGAYWNNWGEIELTVAM